MTDVLAPSLTVFGSGGTTTLAGNVTVTSGSQTSNDSVRVSGGVNVTAQAGNLTFGQSGFAYFVVGDSTTTTDTTTGAGGAQGVEPAEFS